VKNLMKPCMYALNRAAVIRAKDRAQGRQKPVVAMAVVPAVIPVTQSRIKLSRKK
jgi:hypothetical protein